MKPPSGEVHMAPIYALVDTLKRLAASPECPQDMIVLDIATGQAVPFTVGLVQASGPNALDGTFVLAIGINGAGS